MGSPILFKQLRPGLNGNPFYIYKFRTMTNSTDSNQKLLPDDKRLTSFGKFIRRHSLDELPQLLNVIRGEMSFVGPRPLLMEYTPLFNNEQLRRLEVRPGITGWSQINGRNAISWDEKFKLDIWYVDHRTFLLDVKIILITILRVFLPKDINSQGTVTAEKFEGNIEEKE
jgi:sugar transferase EpsL